MPTGNKASELFAQKLQENLGKIGIEVTIATREWATFLENLYEREFDCANLAWITPVESDPEQIWAGYQADVPRSSNHSGFKSEKVDKLIDQIKVEMDTDKRNKLFHQMQAEIYAGQPYMFGVNQPKKFAMSRRVRNLKTYGMDPGYRIRDWYIVDGGTQLREASGPK
jgi:ABC-type transport system substrate-binding protein